MDKIKVLLADDHETVLARVRGVLGEGFDIVGTVNNGKDAVLEAQRLTPDVLVMDISMPIVDGLQAALRLKDCNANTKIVFLTVHEDADFVSAAFSAGASGYVTKAHLAVDLLPAIREAMAGRNYVSRSRRGSEPQLDDQ